MAGRHRTLVLVAGGVTLAGGALFRARRRRREASREPDRAEELRRKLDESRALTGEREEFESGETPVDRAEPEPGVDERRRSVHEQGRAAIDEMRPPDA